MSEPESAPALAVRELVFRYGSHDALQKVSLTVPTGRFVALLGANGAGKTTLFSIITGLYSAHGGSVTVMGHDLRKNTLQALAGMGVVFQKTTLDMDLTVQQNLHYSAALQGITRKDAEQRVSLGIAQHDLTGLEKRKVAALSGGQRRRVELARALLHKPKLLLLDEPTVGLDLRSRADFVAHVKNLCVESGTGVLWATHLMDEVTPQDDAFVLDKGVIIAEGEVAQLLVEHQVDSVTSLFNKLIKQQST